MNKKSRTITERMNEWIDSGHPDLIGGTGTEQWGGMPRGNYPLLYDLNRLGRSIYLHLRGFPLPPKSTSSPMNAVLSFLRTSHTKTFLRFTLSLIPPTQSIPLFLPPLHLMFIQLDLCSIKIPSIYNKTPCSLSLSLPRKIYDWHPLLR